MLDLTQTEYLWLVARALSRLQRSWMHSVTLSACLLCQQLQVVADCCDCNVSDSQALLKCLRKKSSVELQILGQVRREGEASGG